MMGRRAGLDTSKFRSEPLKFPRAAFYVHEALVEI
jgi:hypothetical protein